jgi:hypothetical protein
MSSEISGFTNPKQLVSLIKDADAKADRIASINGELRERIKNAVDNGKLHAKAFSFARAVYRMSEEKRDEYLRHVKRYLEIMEEEGLLGSVHVGDLDDLARKAAAEEAEREQADAAIGEENARLVMEGIKPLDGSDAEFDDATSPKPSRRRAKKDEDAPADEAPGSYRYN